MASETLCVICGVGALLLTFIGCGAPAGASAKGCLQNVHGVQGVVRPETSRLSCRQIVLQIQALPASPGSFLLEVSAPQGDGLWKCRLLDARRGQLLLKCAYGKSHFSIVRRKSSPDLAANGEE
jgi:hypothetical protein